MYPLAGVKILDLTNLLPGPYATLILSELGAEVIKVERPQTGDPARHMIPGLFEGVNRGKKSVELNLKDEEDKEVFCKLVEQSDVVIEGFRPGVMDRLGFSKEEINKINPQAIYCSISGYGQTGPYRDLPGHDVNYLAVAGVLSISGDADGIPEAAGGVQVADLASSLYAVISILAALQQRDRTGEGTYIDLSMTDSALALMIPRIAEYYGRNKPAKSLFMGRSAYGAYETKDQKYVSIGCVEEPFWQSLCKVLNVMDLANDAKYDSWTKRMEHADYINSRLRPLIKEKNLAEWLRIFKEHDIPCSPVNFIEDLIEDPQLINRNVVQNSEAGLQINLPFNFDGKNIASKSHVPELGEHNEIIKK